MGSTAPTTNMQHRNTFLVSTVNSNSGSAGVDGSQHRHGAPEGATLRHDVPHGDHFGGVDDRLVLVILNTKGEGESDALFRHLWESATLRVCADGGANRLHDSFDDHNEDRDGDSVNDTAEQRRARFVPDVIVGDLDSLRPEVAAYYQALGTEVKIYADQDHNDFEKCLLEIEGRLGAGKSTAATAAPTKATVIGLGAFGGRFDHEMAAMSVLHTYTSRFSRLVLMGAGNIAFLLAPGLRHVIQPDARFEGPTVGLIPIGGACRSVTTNGLKWNLQAGRLEFGVLVSSSNCVVGEEVTIVTDAPLVWTAEFKAEEWAKVADRVGR